MRNKTTDLERKYTACIVDEVAAEIELRQRRHLLKTSHRCDAVVLQREILQLGEIVQPTVVDTVDKVVCERQALQLRPVSGAVDVPYTVVL